MINCDNMLYNELLASLFKKIKYICMNMKAILVAGVSARRTL